MRTAPTIVAQALRREPVPWEHALALVLERAGDVEWSLTGSCALAARGIGVEPRDLDIFTDYASAHALAERLDDVLVEPIVDTPDWVATCFARAFAAARIEWAGDFVDPFGAERETITWHGAELSVPLIAAQRASALSRGLTDRVAAIDAAA